MALKNVRNLLAGHLRAGEWFFGPKGTIGDTVPNVDEASIPEDVVALSKLSPPLLVIEAVVAAAPVVAPEPLVVPDNG
jgi:hypothetical protein